MKHFSVTVNNDDELQVCYEGFNRLTGNKLSTSLEYSYPCNISTQVEDGYKYYDWVTCIDHYTFNEFIEQLDIPCEIEAGYLLEVRNIHTGDFDRGIVNYNDLDELGVYFEKMDTWGPVEFILKRNTCIVEIMTVWGRASNKSLTSLTWNERELLWSSMKGVLVC